MLNTPIIGPALQWILDLQEPLWLLTAVIPLTLAYAYVTRRRRRPQVFYRNSTVLRATLAHYGNRNPRRGWLALLLIVTLLALPVAASRPTIASQTATEQSLITWVIDTSQSMEVVDVNNQAGQKVSRLAGVIEALQLTANQAPPNTFRQLVTFSDENNIVTHELTRESTELLAQIDQLAETELTRSTDTEKGLATATENCIRTAEIVEQYGSLSSSTSSDESDQLALPCIIILLSDGECDNQPFCVDETIDVAATGQERGMKIHAVAWGDPEGDRSKVFLPDHKAMKAIAVAGGGQYLETADTTQLVQLYNEVLEQVKTETVPQGAPWWIVWIARLFIAVLTIAFWLGCLMAPEMVVGRRPVK